jgi:hypothetical protein
MLESHFQVIVDRLIGDLAQQCQVRNTDLLLLRSLKGGLFDLRLAGLSAIANIGGSFRAAKSTLLFPALRAS